MSRKHRFVLAGVPQHVIQRGHNRMPCFFTENDYHHYLHDLHEAALKNALEIHTYVLMTNYIHLLVTPKQPYSITHTMNLWSRFIFHEQYQCYKGQ